MRKPGPMSPLHLRSERYLEPDDHDALSVDGVIEFIRRSWRLCLVWLGLGLFAGVAFLIVMPRYYTAYTTIFFYDKGARAGAGAASSEDAIASTYVDTQVELLRSEEVIGRVVDQNRLMEDPEFGVGRATASPADRHATILQAAAGLTVHRIGLSSAVTIGFMSKDRGHAATIANAVVRAYTEARRDIDLRDRAEAEAELQKRLAELRQKVLVREPAHATNLNRAATNGTTQAPDPQDTPQAYQARYNNLLRGANTLLGPEFSSLGMRVITPAEPPLRPSWPRPSLLVAVAILLSGVIGIGHAVLREVTNHSLRSVSEAQRVTGLDCVIPIPKVESSAWLASPAHAQASQPAGGAALQEFGKAIVRLVLQLREAPNRPVVVAVVAPAEGAGVSSVAAHLAAALADSGDRTLLVDANWQKPALSEVLSRSDHIRRQGTRLAEIRAERPATEKFDLLELRQAEPISPLNASLSIAAALGQLRTEYNNIVVDFYSAEKTSDLKAAITAIDSVIVIVEAERTTIEGLDALFRVLPNEKIAAVVINKLGPDTNGVQAEFMHLIEPIARSIATACASAAALLRRLTARGRTACSQPAVLPSPVAPKEGRG